MRIAVIGGSGHIGTMLIPRLVADGHEVVNLARGTRAPYVPHGAWRSVQSITVDRELEEQSGAFGERVAALQADVVIDLICFTLESARQLVEALRGRVGHFLHCGTIWIHGYNVSVPADETQPRRPLTPMRGLDLSQEIAYGVQKAEIEAYLWHEARHNGFPATVLHPGHIVGQGYWPLNPQANFNPEVFRRLAHGVRLTLPHFGMETLHHVHSDDVAQAFMAAIAQRSASLGESFHVVSPAALTLRGYAEAVAAWFGQHASLEFQPWEAWRAGVSEADATATYDHIAHSPTASIDKARRMLGYQPRYSSLEAIFESLTWMMAHGELTTGWPEAAP